MMGADVDVEAVRLGADQFGQHLVFAKLGVGRPQILAVKHLPEQAQHQPPIFSLGRGFDFSHRAFSML